MRKLALAVLVASFLAAGGCEKVDDGRDVKTVAPPKNAPLNPVPGPG